MNSSDSTIYNQVSQYLKKNLVPIGVGLAITGLVLSWKLSTRRHHPDIKKVLFLRQTIQKSYHLALGSLSTLQIQKQFYTQYETGTQTTQYSQGLKMLYLVMSKLKQKQKKKQQQLRNPFLPPFQQGLFISQLQPKHRLLYNKYNIFRNHLLVVTKEFQKQQNGITQSDFKQVLLTIRALDGLFFFNCGKQSGASQPHKHIQICPAEALELPIIKQILKFLTKQSKRKQAQKHKILQFPSFNFIHGLIILKQVSSISSSKGEMSIAYKKLVEFCFLKTNSPAYNVIGTQKFILLIPRRNERAFNEISVNSTGFMGSLLFKDQEKLNKFISLRIKPRNILEDITFPKDYDPMAIQAKSRCSGDDQ